MPPEDADDLAGFQQGQVQRDLGDACRKANHKEPTGPGHRANDWLGIVATDRVIGYVDALRTHQILDFLGKRTLGVLVHVAGVNQRFICTDVAAELCLFLGRHSGNHACARSLAQLDRGHTDAFKSAQDE